MRHLVIGGTGTVGSGVVSGLLARGEEVRVLTRSPERAAQLPAGAIPVIGDLGDPDTYPGIFRDFDTLFLLNPVANTELQEGLGALNEAVRAGAWRIVYLSIHDLERAPAVPHFAAKLAIENAIRQSGVPFTILRPNNFYQNDIWYRDIIRQYGVYPQPIGNRGVSRVDTRDIATAAVNALTDGEHEGRTYALVGPEVVTGESTARTYSEVLGREVRYAGDDLVEWARQARAMLPGWMVYDFGLMYDFFQREGLVASDAQLRETEAAVGAPPRAFADFARELVGS
jgi:uncharacterized protein YbjT (DUF2867 family)